MASLPAGLTVGTMNFGGRTPEAEAKCIIDAALDRGPAFFDTANVYGDGESERILGRALKGRRERAGLATKVGLLRRGQPEGLSPSRVVAALDESLQRLSTDYVDLYYLHAPDPKTPLAQTLDAVQSLLTSGKVRAWGVSNFAAWQILELNVACDARRMPRPAVSQVLYNLLVRQLELEYFSFTQQHPLHTTVYNPLAGGLLARPIPGPGAAPPAGSRLATNQRYRARYGSEVLAQLARQLEGAAVAGGHSLLTVAYAWLRRRPGVDSILIGPASLAQLEDAHAAYQVPISEALERELDRVYASFVGTDARYAR